MARSRERIVRVGVLQLRDHADVPGPQSVHLAPLLALGNRQVVQLLRSIPFGVVDFLPVGDRPAKDAEIGKLAHMGLAGRLEYERAEGIAVQVPDLYDGIAATLAELRRPLLWRRHQLD